MADKDQIPHKPQILAPAGNQASFLAALAAGADAIYCGLKRFSARMAADNFTVSELGRLTQLAHAQGSRVYVTLNTLIKPGEVRDIGTLLQHLTQWVKPDALIIQDLAMIQLARQVGFSGELHFSTLANVSFPKALGFTAGLSGVTRVVVPRELNIDEIKAMAAACPPGLDLEVFVHGALCYGVSGRCYWSSFLGGRSGLRGRCVQPCRRNYRFRETRKKYFSCQDLSLDVLSKLLLTEKAVTAWKIEGRKKGPHYVYYAVSAYRLLRDHGADPQAKKEALGLLEGALGRPGSHYFMLPQRPWNPIQTDLQTGSGQLIGKVQGPAKQPYLVPREVLLTDDLLRLGYEEDAWHAVYRVTRSVPKKGKLVLKLTGKAVPRSGTPVFLIDRREPVLTEAMTQLAGRLQTIPAIPEIDMKLGPYANRPPKTKKTKPAKSPLVLSVRRQLSTGRSRNPTGLWLSVGDPAPQVPGKVIAAAWWWLPPVIWPETEAAVEKNVRKLIEKGAGTFVLNAPWQIALFRPSKGLKLWAGPFCNAANASAVGVLKDAGFSGVIVSPELPGNDYLELAMNSPLPLGIVISGLWPLCISRVFSDELPLDSEFESPKGEKAWGRKIDTEYWIFPEWKLDLREQQEQLAQAGYQLFVHLEEPLPKGLKLKKRPGLWNWNLNLA